MNQKKIGSFLKELRKEKGITQEQLAEKLNISGRTVSRWETGNNLPDISLLVAIADFYDVDVREIIEGERKSEMMDEEVRDVAVKMADYAGKEKSKLLSWIQIVGIVGCLLLTTGIVFQCVGYQPGLLSAAEVCTTFFALLTMVVITLYVTGTLEKLMQKEKIMLLVKVILIGMLVISTYFVFGILLVFGIGWVDFLMPFQKVTGVENYNKLLLIEEYGGDFDSAFMVFPDDTSHAIDAEYAFSSKTGLFDSDGYVILETEYTSKDYESEVSRLSQITCELSNEDETVVNKIRYDESMYYYPAYIASDGYDYVYEYALLDEDKHSIIYVLLSYPEYVNLGEYRNYLKREASDYNLDNGTVLDNFTIYAHKFSGMDGYLEYSDMP